MNKYIPNKVLLITSLVILFLLIVLTEPAFKWLHHGIFNSLEDSILEPIFYLTMGISTCSLIFVFLEIILFKRWLTKILSWFLPVSLLIIFTSNVYGGIPQPGRTDVAALFSTLLVFITVIFILVQKFYFKVK